MSDATEFDPYALPPEDVRDPPQTLGAALRMIGPGIILAGTIVGSGELILTTGLGARQGFVFLWLILFSCVVKVFVQIELARYAISSARPTLGALNELRGPRLGAHWMCWCWLMMMSATIFQLGAMTGGVGQSLHLAFPQVAEWLAGVAGNWVLEKPAVPWAVLTCLVALSILWTGNYRRIESLTTLLVVGITLLTVSATLGLYLTPFAIPWDQFADGLKFRVPSDGLTVAFGVFGITGVGASELFYYPYWCLEKGYARYVGVNDGSPAWEQRARGWMRVLYLDAWVSMVVFTVSTVAFYVMGAAVLHPQQLVPEANQMIDTLARMFGDTYGAWTRGVFLIGAGAVLFKTLYLSSAGNGRMLVDFLGLAGLNHVKNPVSRAAWIRSLSLLFPVVALLLFLAFKEPVWMVTVGAVGQALTLPLIAGATLYFRFNKTDKRLAPTLAWDIVLCLAALAITIVALYVGYDKVVAPWLQLPPSAR